MNSIEETLWNYMDGSCTPDEHERISHLIKTDDAYKKHYEQLLAFEHELKAVELDEPPMAFTYNVMEHIRTQEAQVPLKNAINKNIIRGIAAFFLFTIVGLVVYVLGQINWAGQSADGGLGNSLNISRLSGYLSGPALTIFMFVDVILLLLLADNYLRKQQHVKAGQINLK